MLARYEYKMPLFDDQWVSFHFLGMVFLYIALALSIGSAVQYTFAFIETLKQSRGPEA